jgi:hypothetical protein
MSLETLEFVIYPDGRVQEKVTGIIGNSCAEVTKAIEEQLGLVLHQENTADYFAQQSYQTNQAANTNQVTASEW